MRDPYSFEGELEQDETGCRCGQHQAREYDELELDETDELDELEELDEFDELEDLELVEKEPPDPDYFPGLKWPKGTLLKREPGTIIPAGPYTTGGAGGCQNATTDFTGLRTLLTHLEKRIQRVRALNKQKPRDQEAIQRETATARKEITTIKIHMQAMIKRVRDGTYKRQGCGPKGMAQLTCRMRTLHGVWCELSELKTLRCQLVYWLRKARGTFASTDCSKLGINLPRNWCAGHKCCCPGDT